MSFMGGITDFLTGGANSHAEQALNDALATISGVHAPSKDELTLPQLEKFVQQGLMTPAQAQAILQQKNAYDSVSTDPRAREASIDALTRLQEIGDSGGHDATSEAASYDALSKANQHTQSTRASILDQMAQRGIPLSLMGVTSQLAAAGQDAEQAHKDQLQVNADAQSRALAAMEAGGTLGNQIEAQQFGEQSTKAAAQNAIDQWNAANATNVNLANADKRQQAESFNQQTKQNTANANTQNDNTRTAANASIPQQIYNNAMQKANALAGIYGKQADQQTGVAQQNAGTAGAIINLAAPQPFTGQSAGSTAAGSGGGAAPTSAGGGAGAGAMGAFGGGGGAGAGAESAIMLASDGGKVPGHASMPGNHPGNDRVPALLSPGEVVVPRTAAHDPNQAANFIRHLNRTGGTRPVHHEDVRAVLDALTSRRNGGQ